jgi:hypothetical protein
LASATVWSLLAVLVDTFGIILVLVGRFKLAFDFASMIHQDLALVAGMPTAFTMDKTIMSPGW